MILSDLIFRLENYLILTIKSTFYLEVVLNFWKYSKKNSSVKEKW